MPFLSFLLWHKHCKYVFDSAATSRHAMTLESFTSVFHTKSQEDIKTICASLLEFAVTYKELWITVGICALIGALILITRKEIGKGFLKVGLLSIVIYVTYMIGMLGMYLFSMPGNGAIGLSSVERYTKTILIAILYLNMVPAVMLISDLSGKRLITSAAAACMFCLFFAGMYIGSGLITTVVQFEFNNSGRNCVERDWLEDAIKKNDVPMGSSYCILIPENDAGYASYLGKYILQTPINVKVVENEDDLSDISQAYIFNYDQDNDIIQNWIQETYPEQVGNEVIIR